MQTIGQWLEQLGLAQYAQVFERNAVDLNIAKELTQEDLLDLGVEALGHRKVLLHAIAELNGKQASAATPQAVRGQVPSDRSPGRAVERRQLTVMFCDLVGSTALAERLDPEELRDLMQAYQLACGEVIARYDGHVAQYLGDGLMVYFGWPRAHEDDAVRAIHAGLEVVDAVSKLKAATSILTRVGIHTGLVVVGETGQGDASIPKAAVGETPNVAARLQSLAEPSSVIVSERTRSLAAGLFDYVDMGLHSLKGVSEPVHLFRVISGRVIESRFEAAHGGVALTPLVGREEEVALLLRSWQQVCDAEGQVVLVSGEPGIGKSRLTQVLREQIAAQPHTALRYQCSPYHVNSALYPVIEHLEFAASFTREDTPEQKLDKMQAMLVGSEEQIAEAAPLFAALLSLPLERYPPLALSPQKQKEKTLEALAGQVEALSHHQPVLMVFEDVHWIDPTSQESLDVLLPRLQSLPILLVVTYRTEYTPHWTDQAHVTTLGLSRLGRRLGAELVAKVTGGKALPGDVLEQIVAHTDGVPLFVEELTKSVLESELLHEQDDRYRLDAPLPALAIPTTLRDSLIARLDRLAPVRELAQIGACIGRKFSYELLAALSPLNGAKLEEAVEQLTTSGLLFRRGSPPNATYTFKHALVQDAAYDSLLKSKRSQLHAKIAQTLETDFSDRVANEAEVLAHHFTRAGLNERAMPYWIQAGQRSLARVALAEAIEHLKTALSVNESTPLSFERDGRELEIRVLLGTAYFSFLGWAAVEVPQVLTPAKALASRLNEPDKLIAVLYYIWFHHAMRCEYQQSQRAIDELDAISRARNDSTAFVTARMTDSHTLGWMGKFQDAMNGFRVLREAYDVRQHGHLVHVYNHDLGATGVFAGHFLWALGYPEQAREAAFEQLGMARSMGHAFNLAWALTGGTIGLLMRREPDLTRSWIAEGHAFARQHGISIIVDVIAPIYDGYALIVQGQYDEGYTKAAPLAALWRTSGALHMVPFGYVMLAMGLLGLTRFGEAEELMKQTLQIIDQTGHRMDEAETHRMLGEVYRLQPRPNFAAAEASLYTAMRVARSQDAKGFELRAAMSLARLWRDQDRGREASELLAPIYNWFTEGLDTKDLEEAKTLLEELS